MTKISVGIGLKWIPQKVPGKFDKVTIMHKLIADFRCRAKAKQHWYIYVLNIIISGTKANITMDVKIL